MSNPLGIASSVNPNRAISGIAAPGLSALPNFTSNSPQAQLAPLQHSQTYQQAMQQYNADSAARQQQQVGQIQQQAGAPLSSPSQASALTQPVTAAPVGDGSTPVAQSAIAPQQPGMVPQQGGMPQQVASPAQAPAQAAPLPATNPSTQNSFLSDYGTALGNKWGAVSSALSSLF